MSLIEDPQGNETIALLELVDFAGKRVLEIGCGDGRLTYRYAEKTAQVIAIDPDSSEIELAKQELPENLEHKVKFLATDIEDYELPPEKAKFDVAIFAWSL
ncbi:MAG: class I SAM-dependent methyltransferase [Chloroflexi bacterium]|nr:class I SAM-dependent methyltransferase [Chloroflexota bacterium]